MVQLARLVYSQICCVCVHNGDRWELASRLCVHVCLFMLAADAHVRRTQTHLCNRLDVPPPVVGQQDVMQAGSIQQRLRDVVTSRT